MKIEAMQKLTLLDYPQKMAATIFTYGCNFRCPFCHNAGLVTEESEQGLSEEDVLRFLSTRKGILDGVCITGGEPLLQPDIEDFMRKIKDMGFLIKLDTNGSFPKKLKDLVSKGLVDYVAMDVKNSKEKYALTCGKTVFDLSKIIESVDFLKMGTVPYEFRTTVTRTFHTFDDLICIAKWLSGCDALYLQQFVDSGNLIDQSIEGYENEKLKAMYKDIKRSYPATHLRGIS